MGKKLYVGNLGFNVTNSELTDLFSVHGGIASAQVIMDRDTGQSKGFGFVEMETDSAAAAAIAALDGKDHSGRALKVNEAKPKTNSFGAGPRRY